MFDGIAKLEFSYNLRTIKETSVCGIFASNDPNVNQTHLSQINARLSFRGPDGQSDLISLGEWKLYHARLSIIAPTEKFSQPYFSANDGSVIVFNGEILNFGELLTKYKLPQTNSDTAALVDLLGCEDFSLNDIEGFYAFVRIDSNGQLTHCARDRFGVKPLFIYRSGPYITISSEASILSDIFDLPHSDKALEEHYVFRSPIFSGSYFEHVSSVAPGTCLMTGTYFDVLNEIPGNYKALDDISSKLERGLRYSINSRLLSDVPVGLLFSGGIDSNLLKLLSDRKLQCFTGGFQGDYDLEYTKKMISESDLPEIHVVEVNDGEFRERFHAMIALRKEPLSVPNEVILSFLGNVWSEMGGKVLISGEAADEFFAGYDRIFSWAANTKNFDLNTFIDLYCYVPLEKVSPRIIGELEKFFDSAAHLEPFERVRYFFIKMHLPVLFRRLDFALMFSGIEGREPIASYEMFKIAMQCGPDQLLRSDYGKLPLRLLAEKLINEEFAYSKKVGFPVDMGRIFRGTPSKDIHDNYAIWHDENLRAIQ